MAHILFLELEQETHWAVCSVGPAYIAAYLRLHNHKASLLRIPLMPNIEKIVNEIINISPDIIGISLTSRQWLSAKIIVSKIKNATSLPIIAGGLHATFASDLILTTSEFDFVCLGEGEQATKELLDQLDKGESNFNAIKNIRCRDQSKSEIRPPFSPIDDLPFMARDMLDEQYGVRHISTQRGCPFTCSYCAAHHINNLYEGGFVQYGRRRSVKNVLQELHELKRDELNYVVFLDDTFTLNHHWLTEFCDAYAEQIQIPFSINARAETVNSTVLQQLAKAGCRHVIYGVESGSEHVRREILKRNISNEKMIQAFTWTKQFGMLATANYMLGLPGETEQDIQQTLDLHEQLKPDDFGYFVFYPYPGTELFSLCKEKQYLPENYYDLPANHHQSILHMPGLSQQNITDYYDKFTALRICEHTKHGKENLTVVEQMKTAAAQT